MMQKLQAQGPPQDDQTSPRLLVWMLREASVGRRKRENILKRNVQTISTANTVVAKRAMAVRKDRMRILTDAKEFFRLD